MAEFDILSQAYDAMINWDRRLANEAPLFRWLFEQVGAHSVLDASCGTGRHAAMFASWGLRVQGADLSPDMIAWCRQQHGQSPALSWVQRSFTQKAEEPSDVVICTGNSLALAEDMSVIEEAITAMASSARHALLLHVVNLQARPDGPVVWDKTTRVQLSPGEHLLHKGIHRCGDIGYVDFLLTSLGTFEVTGRSIPFAGLRQSWLKERLQQHGFTSVQFFGGYARQGFNEAASSDLIAVALR